MDAADPLESRRRNPVQVYAFDVQRDFAVLMKTGQGAERVQSTGPALCFPFHAAAPALEQLDLKRRQIAAVVWCGVHIDKRER